LTFGGSVLFFGFLFCRSQSSAIYMYIDFLLSCYKFSIDSVLGTYLIWKHPRGLQFSFVQQCVLMALVLTFMQVIQRMNPTGKGWKGPPDPTHSWDNRWWGSWAILMDTPPNRWAQKIPSHV
jgi:hypothetical protein